MAKAATKDSVSADMKPIDFRGAIKRLGTIKAKSDKQKALAGEISDVYSKCEGIHGVNKQACKIFQGLSKLDEEDREQVFRDLNGLMDAAGFITESADLVDQADGKVVKMRMPEKKKKDPEPEDGSVEPEIEEFAADGSVIDPDDDFEEMSEEEIAGQEGRQNVGEYTGDNSDLAGDEG